MSFDLPRMDITTRIKKPEIVTATFHAMLRSAAVGNCILQHAADFHCMPLNTAAISANSEAIEIACHSILWHAMAYLGML